MGREWSVKLQQCEGGGMGEYRRRRRRRHWPSWHTLLNILPLLYIDFHHHTEYLHTEAAHWPPCVQANSTVSDKEGGVRGRDLLWFVTCNCRAGFWLQEIKNLDCCSCTHTLLNMILRSNYSLWRTCTYRTYSGQMEAPLTVLAMVFKTCAWTVQILNNFIL